MRDRKTEVIDGVEYFKGNGLVRFLLSNSEIGLDKLWVLYENGLATKKEIKEFYQLLGYSLTDYHEIFPDEEGK